MAEALSIAASVVAILQITQSVLSVCYDYNSALKGASWEVPRVKDEIEGLRTLLQSLEPLMREAEFAEPAAGTRLPTLKSLCGPGSVLESCRNEMLRVEKKFKPPGWSAALGPKRKAAIESLRWPFKETETTKILERIGRWREILGFAISADDTKLALAMHDLELETNTTVFEIKNTVFDIKSQADTAKIGEQRKAIRQWLSSPDPMTNHDRASRSHQGTTGSWFLESETFARWKAQKSLVWLHGKPGCGKTVLSSTIINQIYHDYPSSHDIAIVYFYFDFNDLQKQEPENMIRSLILQVFDQCTKAFNKLRLLFSACNDGQRQPDVESLVEVFREIVAELDKTFVVLDALDECRERPELFKIVEQIHRRGSQQLHMLVTSRNLLDVTEALEPLTDPQDRMSIETTLVNTDILAYVNERLHYDAGLKRWNRMPQVQEEIRKMLMKKADGMFRWAVCQLDALRPCTRLPILRTALNTLPRTLDETYSRILCSIPEEHSEDVIKILQWLTYSARPMQINELAEVVAVNVEGKPWFDLEDRFPEPREVLSICSGLVTTEVVEKRDWFQKIYIQEHIRLAHFSVQEYLISDRIEPQAARKYAIQEISAHKTIAATCLAYLLQLDHKDAWMEPIGEDYPLINYAVHRLAQHARYVETDNLIRILILELLVHCEEAYVNWIDLRRKESPRTERPFHIPESSNPLHYAAWTGLSETVRLLLDEGADINARSKQGDTALHFSSSSHYGCVEMVQVLLERGADVNAEGGRYGPALQAASARGYEKVVQLLLENGADVNTKGGWYGTALEAASSEGHAKVVQLLLENGADVNTEGGWYGTALQAASYQGNEKVVQSLLEKGADVNAGRGRYGTALQAVSYQGNEKVVHLLLEKGADVNARGGHRGTALQAASSNGDEKVVQLLESGPNLTLQNREWGTALQQAAASPYHRTQVVQLLLSHGADANMEGGEHGTALELASWAGNVEVVQLLLESGAHVTADGKAYCGALQAAAAASSSKNKVPVIQLLLDYGADVNAAGGKYGTALQAASYVGHEKIIQLLLGAGAGPTLQGGYFGSALNAARKCRVKRRRKAAVRLIKSALRSQRVAITSPEASDNSEEEFSDRSEDEFPYNSENEGSDVSVYYEGSSETSTSE